MRDLCTISGQMIYAVILALLNLKGLLPTDRLNKSPQYIDTILLTVVKYLNTIELL